MISAIKIIRSAGTAPYENIALERVLARHAGEGECILFLWQNRNTVVIGRNQNAWEECRVGWFRDSEGFLARRLSGGGAVYHDLGNLNFSFLVRKADFDPVRQTGVVLRAARKLGAPAERTGRNDIEAEGRKFSGCAFYEEKGCCCHHGTLMMHVDLDRMEEALTVPRAKLASRGVASVRARVVNLREYCPELDRARLEAALVAAFEDVYGLRAEELDLDALDASEIRREAVFLASEEWILGRRIPFTAAMERRFAWGGVRLELSVAGGKVAEAVCWSDAMDAEMIRRMAEALRGCAFDSGALAERLLRAAGDQDDPDHAENQERGRMAAETARMIREDMDGIKVDGLEIDGSGEGGENPWS